MIQYNYRGQSELQLYQLPNTVVYQNNIRQMGLMKEINLKMPFESIQIIESYYSDHFLSSLDLEEN